MRKGLKMNVMTWPPMAGRPLAFGFNYYKVVLVVVVLAIVAALAALICEWGSLVGFEVCPNNTKLQISNQIYYF